MKTNSFLNGVIAGCMIMLMADAVHWFVSMSQHPDASPIRRSLVILQALLSAVIASGLYIRESRRNRI